MEAFDVCRLCGSSEEITINIFEPGSEYRHYIHSLLPIWVNDCDNLPKKLCYRCQFKLREFYEFREQCIYTDIVLKKRQDCKGFGSATRPEEMCMGEKKEDDVFLQINEQFEVRQETLNEERLGSSDTDTIEIITIKSRSPSPIPASDFDSSSQNACTRIQRNNSDNSAESESKGRKCKRKERDECTVLLHIPDENANISERNILDENCCSFNVNRSKSKHNPVVGKRVKHSGSNTETGQATDLNVKPVNGDITELSKKCVVKDDNAAEIEKETSEKYNITSGKSCNSKQNKNVPKNIIVTKIPGLYNVYTCSYCERTFITRESAESHDCDVQPFQSEKLSYECEICSKGFSRQATLLAHHKYHSFFSSDEDS